MSFLQDLQRNRSAFRALSTAGAELVENRESPGLAGFDEGGFVSEAQYAQNREIASSQRVLAGENRDLGLSGQAVAKTGPETGQEVPKVYRLGSPGESRPVAAVVSPTSEAVPPTGGADSADLLDSLLRRMEQSARRYPQEISQEGGLW